jgi:hypothetical protein
MYLFQRLRQRRSFIFVAATTLFEIYSYYKLADHWVDLLPTERITLESMWTDSMLKLLMIGNGKVMRSIRYRLREQTPEEEGEFF